MSKQLKLNQIEITTDNIIQLRFDKISSDGDFLGYHRTSIEFGVSPDEQINIVNIHMAQDNYAPVSQEDVDKIKKIVNAL